MTCLSVEEALSAIDDAPGGSLPLHAAECGQCAALVDDMRRVRRVARQIGSSAWADVPALDVDLALRRVRARALRASLEREHSGRGLRPEARGRVPQVLSAAAAAFLLCALIGPYAVRQRVERPTGDVEGFRPHDQRVVFWTSGPADLALSAVR